MARLEAEALDPPLQPSLFPLWSRSSAQSPPGAVRGGALGPVGGAEAPDLFLSERSGHRNPRVPASERVEPFPHPAACSSPVCWPRCAACCSAPLASSPRLVSPSGLAPVLPAAQKFSATPSLLPLLLTNLSRAWRGTLRGKRGERASVRSALGPWGCESSFCTEW